MANLKRNHVFQYSELINIQAGLGGMAKSQIFSEFHTKLLNRASEVALQAAVRIAKGK